MGKAEGEKMAEQRLEELEKKVKELKKRGGSLAVGIYASVFLLARTQKIT